MNAVLLLNATHEPLAVLSVARAAKLVFKQRVEAMVAEQATLTGNDGVLSVPSVLRLKVFVNVPRRNAPAGPAAVYSSATALCAPIVANISRLPSLQ